uniref:Reverse transcriptase RNase H-like domain-containing protein n=1 Tax=Cacopsylla melanoneura TaxID=428564 RepID=A0A8D9EUF8_9HEMI
MLATIDRSDALYHVPVERLHRRFLAFRYQGITYWTCLQFSLAFAPQAFSQLTNWVAAFLRSWSVRIIVYLSRSSPRHATPIPQAARKALDWWLQHLGDGIGYATPKIGIVLSTDASDWGLGVSIGASLYLRHMWTPQQRAWHINRKELYAVRWALESNPLLFTNRTITVLTDSTVVASQIRRQGGLRSATLLRETSELLHLVLSLRSVIKPVRLPGVYNTIADHISRNMCPPEWHLLSKATSAVFRRWGTPTVDLFASRRSAVVPSYVSLNPDDHQALFVDALSRPWNFDLAWVFPPPPLIPLVLQHLETATGTFLLVTPRWEKTFWRPDVKARAVDAPIKLKDLSRTLLDLSTNKPPPDVQDLQLEVWKLRGGRPTLRSGPHQSVVC